MRRATLIVILICLSVISMKSQVNGTIVSTEGNVTVVKVWGTHEDRGYAVGYLLADQIVDLYQNYIVPSFGTMLSTAKMLIESGDHIVIDSTFVYEAMAMYDGVVDAGYSLPGVDYLDLLVANCFIDIENLSAKELNMGNGCSSLMSWGDATAGTELDGKSVISRHVDWSTEDAIVRNQVVVVHFPYEPDESPWCLIGFAGQMSVLSGFNENQVAVMQHMLADVYANGSLFQGYEPIWFTLRRAIESRDYNGDDANDVQDVKDAVLENTQGYADSYIVTALAASTVGNDSLISMVAEVSPEDPKLNVRNWQYHDDIPGDNLYAANSSIVRNHANNYCMRYNAVKDNMGDGTGISAEENWRIMIDHSSSCAFGGTGNIQFMQYIPEDKILRLSVHLEDGTQACENDSLEFNVDDLFTPPLEVQEVLESNDILIYPNPSDSSTKVMIPESLLSNSQLQVFSTDGKKIKEIVSLTTETELNNLSTGVYVVVIKRNDKVIKREKVVVY